MEFRCRLASPNGEIVEGVYVADTEARLRHELEEKGLYVLSLQPKHAIAGISLRLPQRKGVKTREFLIDRGRDDLPGRSAVAIDPSEVARRKELEHKKLRRMVPRLSAGVLRLPLMASESDWMPISSLPMISRQPGMPVPKASN